MIFGMESEILEFKKTTGELAEALNDISAILNKHHGGELYFGIKNDGTVIGQMVSASSLRDVSQAIGTKIKPQIIPIVGMVTIDNKECIRVVFEGQKTPYFADGKAYIRIADESRQLSPEALEEFFRNKRGQVSLWDITPSGAALSDINTNFVRSYMKKANDAGRLKYKFSTLADTLNKLELLEGNTPKNAAMALFGKRPNLEIQMAVFAGKERLTFLDIERKSGTIDQLVEAAMWFFRRNTRWRVELRGTMKRIEIPEVPINALREALLNSYAHKDYQVPQINELIFFSNRIEIYNPGTFPEGYSPEDFIEREEPPIHRNQLLAKTMYYSEDMEGFGTGLKRIADECNAAGVRYEFKKRKLGFAVVFYREELPVVGEGDVTVTSNVTGNIAENVIEKISGRQNRLVELLEADPSYTIAELAKAVGVTSRTIARDIDSLKSLGILNRAGSDKDGHWRIL